MYPGYPLPFRRYIVTNVLACPVGGVRSLWSTIPFSLSLFPCVLFPPLAPIAGDEGLRNVCRWFQHNVSWCIAVRRYHVFHVIAFSYLTHYAIHGVFSRRISNVLLFIPMSPACISSRSASFSSVCVQLSSVGVFFAVGGTVAWSTDMELHMPSLLTVTVVDITSITRNGPVLGDSSLLYDYVVPGILLPVSLSVVGRGIRAV